MENAHQNDDIENTLPSISLPVHGPTHAKRNDCRRWKMLADLKKKSCNKKTVPTTPRNTKLTCLLKQP